MDYLVQICGENRLQISVMNFLVMVTVHSVPSNTLRDAGNMNLLVQSPRSIVCFAKHFAEKRIFSQLQSTINTGQRMCRRFLTKKESGYIFILWMTWRKHNIICKRVRQVYAQTICRILCLTELFCRHYEMIIEDYYSYSCSGLTKGKDIRSKKNFNRI